MTAQPPVQQIGGEPGVGIGDEAPQRARAARYRALRTIFETPVMDEHKWEKIPNIDADMFFLDLEDSVPPSLKEAARERVVAHVRDPSYFGTRLTIARPNHLFTAWGRDDVVALAEAGVSCIAYPKIGSVEDLLEALELLRSCGATPDVYATIETAASVVDLRDIAAVPCVVGLMSGPGDLSVDLGVPLFDDGGGLNSVLDHAKALTVMAGAARGLCTTDIVYAPDYRDLEEIRRRLIGCKRMGFTTMTTFYPPHVPVINEVFTPTGEEVERARRIVAIYERVMAEGRPAALDEDGRTILVHDYQKARLVLQRAPSGDGAG